MIKKIKHSARIDFKGIYRAIDFYTNDFTKNILEL